MVVHGYGSMLAAGFLFLRIRDPRRCGAWLQELLPDITRGSPGPQAAEGSCLNVAFTAQGLTALGLRPEELRTFSFEFRQGMADRAQDLGDVGEHAPEHWQFGDGPEGGLHLLLMLYARCPHQLEGLLARHRARLAQHGMQELFCQKGLRKRDEAGFFLEHFGFRDALSQPAIEGFTDPSKHPRDYDRPLKPGELLLGHVDEFDETPYPPSVPAERDTGHQLPGHGSPSGWKALGHNGTYLVVRKLQQDVAGFERFIHHHAGEDEDLRTLLKAKLIGRWPNGAPLRPGEEKQPEVEADKGITNDFRYMREDRHGYGCPLGSHVRRSNPRDSLAPNAKLSMMIGRRHRILRRGIPYVDGDGTKGLFFMALNADIARQFEFIQRTWLNNEQIAGLDGDTDPLAHDPRPQSDGPQEQEPRPARALLQAQPLRKCLGGLRQFVAVKGGGYFFLPGLRALSFLVDLVTREEPSR
jgi:Dyp-type peroxidase family